MGVIGLRRRVLASALVAGCVGGVPSTAVGKARTERVSVSSTGAQGNGASYGASISADGRFVAFGSLASNLVRGDANRTGDVFVRDRLRGTTERVSVDTAGGEANGFS